MKHFLSIADLRTKDIISLLSRAKYMKNMVKSNSEINILKNKVMSTIFYEPSTRTMCSFQTAMLRLGGNYININIENSSVQKGETLEDTIKTLSCYSDVIIIRHPMKLSILEAAAVSSKPIINAGDGIYEHPTQALLDLFTIKSELGDIGYPKDANKMMTMQEPK